MKAQGLLTLAYVAAVLAYAVADRDGYVSPLYSQLIDRRQRLVIAGRASSWLSRALILLRHSHSFSDLTASNHVVARAWLCS